MSARRPTAPRRRGTTAPGGTADGAVHGPPRAANAPHSPRADAREPYPEDADAEPRPDGAGADRPGRPAAGWRDGHGAPDTRPATLRRITTGRADRGTREAAGSSAPAGEGSRLSLRGLGLILVVVVALAILTPTIRHLLTQQEQLRSISAQVDAARERTEELEHQQRLWADEDYVRSQARDRLGYVMPGERSFVVTDPQTVTGASEDTAEARAAQAARERAATAPWYVNLWESAQVAGTAPAPGAPATPEQPTQAPTEQQTATSDG